MIRLYRALGHCLTPVIDQVLKNRARKGKEDPARAAERRGLPSVPRPDGTLLWFHGASVGELVTLLPLLSRLRSQLPTARILVTSGTVTSAQMAAKRLPDGCFHQYVPADMPGWVDRFLDHWRPDAAFWVESELWPGLVCRAKALGIPMVLVNATLSARSAKRWGLIPRFAKMVIGAFDLVLARTEAVAERYQTLGAKTVTVLGDLKLAGEKLPVDEADRLALGGALDERLVFLAASTHEGEEAAALSAHQGAVAKGLRLLTVIVPRHPARADAVATLIASRGLSCARRSVGAAPGPKTEVYLADTLGELGLFFSLADVTFIGGSIALKGGHNPLEAAPFETAILMGPDRKNNLGPVEALEDAGALITIEDEAALAAEVVRLLADEQARHGLVNRAMSVNASGKAVLDSTLDAIIPYIENR